MGEDAPSISYFTCTLLEALEFNRSHREVHVTQTPGGSISKHHDFANINEYTDYLAHKFGYELAVGCVVPEKGMRSGPVRDEDEILSAQHIPKATCVVFLTLS